MTAKIKRTRRRPASRYDVIDAFHDKFRTIQGTGRSLAGGGGGPVAGCRNDPGCESQTQIGAVPACSRGKAGVRTILKGETKNGLRGSIRPAGLTPSMRSGGSEAPRAGCQAVGAAPARTTATRKFCSCHDTGFAGQLGARLDHTTSCQSGKRRRRPCNGVGDGTSRMRRGRSSRRSGGGSSL